MSAAELEGFPPFEFSCWVLLRSITEGQHHRRAFSAHGGSSTLQCCLAGHLACKARCSGDTDSSLPSCPCSSPQPCILSLCALSVMIFPGSLPFSHQTRKPTNSVTSCSENKLLSWFFYLIFCHFQVYVSFCFKVIYHETNKNPFTLESVFRGSLPLP